MVRNHSNYDYTAHRGEVNLKPSDTIPDQSLSVRELYIRFAKGLPLEGAKEPVYDFDEDGKGIFVPDIEHMDFAEREELLEAYKADLEIAKEKVRLIHEKRRKAYTDDLDYRKKVDAFNASKKDSKSDTIKETGDTTERSEVL